MRVVKATWNWIDDRLGLSDLLRPLLAHPVPPDIARTRAGWMYVFGWALVIVFILQVVTGIALVLIYVPSTEHAFDSLQFITNEATAGWLVRGMHFFGASAMVILVMVHMARVFLTGSYKFPRELNWLTGLALLVLTFAMVFTGQLLRWDEDSIGSVLVAVEILGRIPLIGEPMARFILAGTHIGGATLTRFYAAHVFIFPTMIALVMGFHLYLVLKHGISEPPKGRDEVDPKTYRERYKALINRAKIPYFPDAAWREILFTTGVIGVIILLAVILGAKELAAPPDTADPEAAPRPDWYLVWAYALFSVIRPFWLEEYVIVLGPLLVFAVLIAITFVANRGERNPRYRPWAVASVLVAFLFFAALTYSGYRAPWEPEFDPGPLPQDVAAQLSDDGRFGAEVFYDRACIYCHAVHGEGGIRAPDLTRIARRLSTEEIRIRTLDAPAGMPSYNEILAPEEMDALIAFFVEMEEMRKE